MFFPQGSIDSGSKCLLSYWDGTDLYVLTDVSTISDNPFSSSYILEKAIVINEGIVGVQDDVASRVAVFTCAGESSSFTLSEISPAPNGALSYSQLTTSHNLDEESIDVSLSLELYANRSILPPKLSVSQSYIYQWPSPSVFLAGVAYTLSTTTSSPSAIKFYKKTSPSTDTLISATPIFIPVTYYNTCTQTTQFPPTYSCRTSTSVINTILVAYCSLSRKGSTPVCAGVDPVGWTTITDAVQNYGYSYCPTDTTVCSTGCKAPCSNDYDTCTWTGTEFSCNFNPNQLFSGEWWKSWWFIGGLIVLFFLVALFIIVLVYATRKKN